MMSLFREQEVYWENQVKWHKWHHKFSHAIVTGFRFPVPSMDENFRGAILAT